MRLPQTTVMKILKRFTNRWTVLQVSASRRKLPLLWVTSMRRWAVAAAERWLVTMGWDRNERGHRWVEWCESWGQIIMNTFIRHHPRHLYTWKSPGDRVRNQIDYITVNRRFRNSISHVMMCPGADCGVGYDHKPMVAQIKLKLKEISKNKRVRRDWNILRRDRSVGSRYAVEVRNRYEALAEVTEDEGVNRDFRILQDSPVDSVEKLITRERKRGRQSWMTEEILDFIEQRQRMMSQSIGRYKDLDWLVETMCKERKEEWLRERCQEMEQLERVDSRLMAEKIREITGKKRTTRSTILKDRNDNILTIRIDVLNRWREYVEMLYRDDRDEKSESDGCEQGPSIFRMR